MPEMNASELNRTWAAAKSPQISLDTRRRISDWGKITAKRRQILLAPNGKYFAAQIFNCAIGDMAEPGQICGDKDNE